MHECFHRFTRSPKVHGYLATEVIKQSARNQRKSRQMAELKAAIVAVGFFFPYIHLQKQQEAPIMSSLGQIGLVYTENKLFSFDVSLNLPQILLAVHQHQTCPSDTENKAKEAKRRHHLTVNSV